MIVRKTRANIEISISFPPLSLGGNISLLVATKILSTENSKNDEINM